MWLLTQPLTNLGLFKKQKPTKNKQPREPVKRGKATVNKDGPKGERIERGWLGTAIFGSHIRSEQYSALGAWR
jgi:hypothetical protein